MIFINIGSNLNSPAGNRFDNINKAMMYLKQEKIKIKQKSSFYETPSYPNNKFPKFINICLEIEFIDDIKLLFKKVAIIEKKLFRFQTSKNYPRTCDIDIIDFNGLILTSNKINVPHPRAHKRNFVLFPLKEISPYWVHPKLKLKIGTLIKKLSLKSRNEITNVKENAIIKK